MTTHPTNIPCPKCGKSIEARARYCRHCGHSLTGSGPTANRPPVPGEEPRLRTGQPNRLVALIPILALLVTVLVVLSVLLYAYLSN